MYTPRREIKKYANQKQWINNTLQEVQEKIVSQSSLQTPIPKDKEIKRPSESMSPADSEAQVVEFHVFKGRKKDQ